MRFAALICCLILPLLTISVSRDTGLGPIAAQADPVAGAAQSSLAQDVELAERASRAAREAHNARSAKQAAELARAAEQQMLLQAKAAEAARQMDAVRMKREAALKTPPLPRRNPREGAAGGDAIEAASDWQPGHRSRVRMIAGDVDFPARGWTLAGVQMQLADGWKTYWRSPGDTGVPPTFDWSGSRNLKSAEVLYPVPRKYRDAYSTSVGYKHEVVLPVRIRPVDPQQPVTVKLKFGYGLCEQICVPGESDLELVLPPQRRGRSEALARFNAMVPVAVGRIGQAASGFAIETIDVTLTGDSPAIVIEARVPPKAGTPDLFVEASDSFYLPLPVEEKGTDAGRRRYRIDLTRADPPKDLAGRTLSVTLVGERAGIEYKHKIN